jgi:glucose-6-phosphate-specific signal transduction histidine kinase
LELQDIEIKVDKFRDVLQSISKKAPPPNSMFGQDRDVVREKRLKKIHEFMLGQAMVDLAKELPVGLLSEILSNCGNLEKKIAGEIVDNENNIEDCVTKKLNDVIEERLTVVKKQKSVVAKSHQDHETAKQKHQVSETLGVKH